MSENKNIMILFLSKVFNTEQSFKYKYASQSDIPEIIGIQTNEAAVKAVLHQLHNNNETLSEIYMLCTDTVNNEKINEKETHKTFFIRRITEYCENNEYSLPDFNDIKYDEKSTGDAIFTPIIKMAVEITNSPEFENTFVYADMTGGMRNSSMLMLSIFRLLEYKNINVKKVLYSNKPFDNNTFGPIDDSTDIYKLNNLIAGAEEFVNFGSAKILHRYFDKNDKNYSKTLKDLIRTMNRFSENIRLCRANKFEKVIIDLKNKIDFFENNNCKDNINDKILLLLLPMIKEKYKVLFNDDSKPINMQHLEIIKWCLDMDFLQQALTLYVEWIPDYIVDSELLYAVDDTLKNDMQVSSKKNNNNENYILINAKGLLNEDIKESVIDFHTNNLKFGNTKSCLNIDNALNIIRTYRNIKDKRNNTNHATEYKKANSYKDIKDILDKAIFELKKVTI